MGNSSAIVLLLRRGAQHAHKELRSTPITVTIMPGSKNLPQSYTGGGGSADPDDIAGICPGSFSAGGRSSGLPWWLFIILLLLPACIVLYRRIILFFNQRSRINYRAKRARNAFRHARAQLVRAMHKNDQRQLYRIFTELFADRWQVSVGTISISFLEKRLRDVGMSEEQLVEWDSFFSEISEHAFGEREEHHKKENLFTQAERWIGLLEKVL